MIGRASIALLFAGIAPSPALADPTSGNDFDVTRYELALTPDIENKTVAGRETITLRATGEGGRSCRGLGDRA